jgi:hypothetical protein
MRCKAICKTGKKCNKHASIAGYCMGHYQKIKSKIKKDEERKEKAIKNV